MLDFIYYPVSGIMWVWHWLFDHITPNTPGGDGIAWALSVVMDLFQQAAPTQIVLWAPLPRLDA